MDISYHDLPNYIDPIAFSIGRISIYWYSLMWLTAFYVGYRLLVYRLKKNEGKYSIEFIQDFVVNTLVGALIGGRLGYVLFYDFLYYAKRPLEIISPYDFATHTWIGIYGMSFHGGVLGVAIAIFYTAYKKNVDALQLSDFIVPVVPLGYMFGRLGNFFNEELVGRITTSPWGMYFNGETVLRHPSQLYEAFFEGLVLFAIMWRLRNKNYAVGTMSVLYLMTYSLFRFVIEYYRAPDEHLGFVLLNLTMGQLLSIVAIVICCGFLIYRKLQSDSKKVEKRC